MIKDAPFLIKFPAALIFVIVAGIVISIATALQIYILGWLLGIIGGLF